MSISQLVKKVLERFDIGDEYLVVSGGVMEVLGIRKAADIDILISARTFKELAKHPDLNRKDERLLSVEVDGREVELFVFWEINGMSGDMIYENFKDRFFVVQGIKFINLEEVLKWKQDRGRQKDQADIELIVEYLDQNPQNN
ncbi:MAG: hypothetical protein R3313_03510 [Candidatus Saccharimonadales bacterium]|nr:hypothetical protein [Candidatus Saccharimonadales bacterium]